MKSIWTERSILATGASDVSNKCKSIRSIKPIAFVSLLNNVLSSACGFISVMQFSKVSHKSLPFCSTEAIMADILAQSRL